MKFQNFTIITISAIIIVIPGVLILKKKREAQKLYLEFIKKEKKELSM